MDNLLSFLRLLRCPVLLETQYCGLAYPITGWIHMHHAPGGSLYIILYIKLEEDLDIFNLVAKKNLFWRFQKKIVY